MQDSGNNSIYVNTENCFNKNLDSHEGQSYYIIPYNSYVVYDEEFADTNVKFVSGGSRKKIFLVIGKKGKPTLERLEQDILKKEINFM